MATIHRKIELEELNHKKRVKLTTVINCEELTMNHVEYINDPEEMRVHVDELSWAMEYLQGVDSE